VGKPEEKRRLGRSRRRWVANIKIDLREIGCNDMDWIDLAQDRDPAPFGSLRKYDKDKQFLDPVRCVLGVGLVWSHLL
jgi:hypothetical protein